MSQVLTLDELAEAGMEWRREGAVIVLAAGAFDPLHAGHTQHLAAAKELGNVLVVAVASNRLIREYKQKPGGPKRPFMPEEMRAEIIAALRCVDAVVINDAACHVIRNLYPHIYVKGTEYDGNLTPDLKQELEILTHTGGKLVFVSGRKIHSSSALLAATV